MTRKPRNVETKEEIKNSIIEKSLEVMISDGFNNMTMRKIASKTGMSATNLYNYFSNKDEIYINILIKGYEKLYLRLKEIFKSELDPVERGRKFIGAYLNFGINNNHYYDIMFNRPTPKYNDYVGTPLESLAAVEMELSNKIIGLALETISIFTDNNSKEKKDIEKKILFIWSLLHGMITLYKSNIASYVANDPEKIYKEIIDELIEKFKLV
jgi:AcrR family transcriptional regulator